MGWTNESDPAAAVHGVYGKIGWDRRVNERIASLSIDVVFSLTRWSTTTWSIQRGIHKTEYATQTTRNIWYETRVRRLKRNESRVCRILTFRIVTRICLKILFGPFWNNLANNYNCTNPESSKYSPVVKNNKPTDLFNQLNGAMNSARGKFFY